MADTTTENGASEAVIDMKTENSPVAKSGEEVTSSDGAGEVSQLEAKIIKQVEFYFGDMNLIKDKFLQEQIKEDDGWVSMETMIKFKRLADLSTDFAVILNALKKSTAGLMEVGDNKIRRCPDKKLPDTFDALKSATKNQRVYCKGFPGDATLDDIMEFMEQFGKTEHILMRRDKDKKFKGSIFVTYATEESAKKFVAAESLKFKDQEEEVIKSSKEDYFQHLADEKKALKRARKKCKK